MNTTDFNKNQAETNRRIKMLDESFKEASIRARAFGETADTLSSKHKALSEKMKIQTSRVTKLKAEYEKIRKEKGENNKETDNAIIKYNKAVTALTRLEGQLEKVNKDIDKQSKELSDSQKKLTEYGQKMKDVSQKMNNVSNQMLKFSGAILGIGVAITKIGIDFDTGMRKVKTIADETQISIKQLSDSTLELSSQYGIANTEVANALYETLSAGVETGKSINFLNDAIKNSVGGFTDVTTSVNTLTNILNAYGLETEKATIISDKLLVLQKLGKTTIDNFGDTIGRVAPLAAQANVSVDELLSSITALTKGSIKDKEAITAMKAAISNIIKPSAEATKAAKRLGINFSASGLKAKGFAEFLELVMKRTNGNTETLAKLFGSVEALNAVMLLTSKKGSKDFKEALEAMEQSAGTTDKAVADMDGTGRTLAETINSIRNTATVTFQSLESGIKGVLGVINLLFGWLAKLDPRLVSTVAIFTGFVFVLGLFIKMGSTLTAITGLLTTGLAGMGIASTGASVGMGALGAASVASVSPILIVTGALAALAVVLAVIIGRGKDVKETISSVGSMKMPKIEVPEVPDIQKPRIKYNTYNVNGYDTGTNRLSRDQLILAHKDEAIIPAKDNPYNPNAKTYGKGGDTHIHVTVDAKNFEDVNTAVKTFKELQQTVNQGIGGVNLGY